jgi:GDP-6-deoxy-D-talose 4-dehydrogenase
LASPSERILITGGTGFTGRPLIKRLQQDGYEVFALGHDATDESALKVDLRDVDSLQRTVAQIHPDAIVHLAGIAATTYANVGEIYTANVVGTVNLLAALTAAKIEPRLIIIASSAQVYEFAGTDTPVTEDCRLSPKTHYAVSKRAAEEVSALYSRQFPIVITRPFNYTGPGQSPEFLVPKIVRHYAEKQQEIRVGNLDLYRDFSDISRVVEAYARLLSPSIRPTTVNICSGRAIHLRDIMKILDEISGHPVRAVTDSSLVRGDEPRFMVGSVSRLETLVGPLPNPEFRETLARIYDSFCRRRNTALG